MGKNEFLADAVSTFKRVTSLLIEVDQDNDEYTVDSCLYFAFGAERMTKAVLWNVNPCFVYENNKFDNLILVLYGEHFVASPPKTKDHPNSNTIGNAEALFRAKAFSKTVSQHYGKLTLLADYRNIIAHDRLSKLDTSAIRRFMRAYFYLIVTAFASEVGIDTAHSFGEIFDYLKGDSERLVMVETTMDDTLRTHRELWATTSQDAFEVEVRERTTISLLNQHSVNEATRTQLFPCPACAQPAVLKIENDSPDGRIFGRYYEPGSNALGYIGLGYHIDHLWCCFCGFRVFSQVEMDYLELYQRLNSPEFVQPTLVAR
jgi:hypothetical protein